MKRALIKDVCLLMSLIFFVIGCSPMHARKNEMEAYLVTQPESFGEEKFIFGLIYANPDLDLAEGGDGRVSWPLFVFDEDGKHREYLATDFSEMDSRFWNVWFDKKACMKKFAVLLPASEAGKRFVLVSRAYDAIYNINGEEVLIDPYAEIKMEKYKGFMSSVDLGNKAFKYVDQNSPEVKIIKAYLAKFYAPIIKKKLDYVKDKYGTTLTEQEWKKIAKLDETVSTLIEWLPKDLYGIVGIPLVGVETRLIQMSLIKLIRIPEAFSKVDKPGYATHKPNTRFISRMFRRNKIYENCK